MNIQSFMDLNCMNFKSCMDFITACCWTHEK